MAGIIKEFKDFCRRNTDNPQLKFLLPLDGWLAMIVYPNPQVKNMAHKEGVHDLIANIKSRNSKPINPRYEQNMMPVELDLDLCDHF